ncbi:uncharacterized protein [Periplaneta americana]|uniref:uncharacterized protein n=1 Tax=Periplaneta americana TaxID=6978 RepID=UPI0037E91B16
MAAKKQWSVEETKRLIEAYKLESCLWNVFDSNYKSKDLRNRAMSKIAETAQASLEEVQRKLHNLRCQYTGELRKTKTRKSGNGAGDTYVSTWPYFQHLKFLTNSISLRGSLGNELPQAVVQGQDEEAEKLENPEVSEVSDSEGNTSESTVPVSQLVPHLLAATSSRSNKRKKSSDEDRLLGTTIEVMQKSQDDIQKFGDFVAAELRGLRNPRALRQAKNTIMQALMDAAAVDYESSVRVPPTSSFRHISKSSLHISSESRSSSASPSMSQHSTASAQNTQIIQHDSQQSTPLHKIENPLCYEESELVYNTI